MRAQDKTEQMQARADALDELLASGAPQDAALPGGRDDLQPRLDALTGGHDVDDELARMKTQLPAPAPPTAIEGPGTASAGPPTPAGRPPTPRVCARRANGNTAAAGQRCRSMCCRPRTAQAAIHQLRSACRPAGPAASLTWVPDTPGQGSLRRWPCAGFPARYTPGAP